MRKIAVLIALLATPVATSQCWSSEYYKVDVTRKSQDLYEVMGQGIYVVTRFCYEYVYSSDAIIKIDAPAGYTVGQIIFVGSGGNKCDIEKLLR